MAQFLPDLFPFPLHAIQKHCATQVHAFRSPGCRNAWIALRNKRRGTKRTRLTDSWFDGAERGARKSEAGIETSKLRSSRFHGIPLEGPARRRHTHRKHSKTTTYITRRRGGASHKQLTYRCGPHATSPEGCASTKPREERARQAETAAQRRRSGTFGEERSLLAERGAPGCGNIRLQTAD